MKKRCWDVKCIVLFSGGMDSTILLYHALQQYDTVVALSFDYGQRHSLELKCANDTISTLLSEGADIVHKVIDLKFLQHIAHSSSLTNLNIDTPDVRIVRGEAQPLSYVPCRNMLFLSIAAAAAESESCGDVLYGAAQADSLAGYWDGSNEFLTSINSILSLNREHKINIVAPLINKTKEDIIRMGVLLKVMYSKTYTCYSGDDKPSIYSPSSSLRLQGFTRAGFIDPLEYKEQDMLNTHWKKSNCIKIPYEQYLFI